jgi:uncharacterized protein (TIGR00297 family)
VTLPLPLALALGPAVALATWRAGLLDPRASLAAAVLGSATAIAGVDWMALLLAFFASSVALGRLRRAAKHARTRAVLDDVRARTARQVLANGGLFGLGALTAVAIDAGPSVQGAALGALAAATADTWATEVGLAIGGTPRHILTFRPLAPGLSGGVTLAGTAATVAGAALLALLARTLGWPAAAATAGALGGVAGSLADSVLGATLQSRRRAADGTLTERTADLRGIATMHATGLRWLDNDGVNFAATATGALVAWLAVRGAGA